MAQLDYSVNKPASPMQGLQMLTGGIDNRQDYNRKLAAANREKELRKQAYDIMQAGTPEQVDEFITKNPGGRKIFEDVAQFKSETTKNNAIDTAKKILLEGAEVGPAMIERAKLVMAEGGDSKETIESAQRAVQDPEKGRDWAMKVLQLYEPATYKAFISGGKDGKDKRTPDILNFDQAVKGGYLGSFIDFLAEKKTKPDTKTKDIKEFEYGKDHPEFLKDKNVNFGDFTPEQMNAQADQFSETGKFEFTGRSMEIKNHNAMIKKLSLERQKAKGIDAVSTLYNQLDKKGMTKDIDAQQKKYGSMRSFSKNIDKQAEKIDEVGKRLYKYDTKLLNVPINMLMKKVVGSPDRAVLQLLIGELSEEIGKLASGATDSVAALSEGGREKWDDIFDPNLSYNALKQLVEESKEVAHMRIDSMSESLSESRRIRKGGKIKKPRSKYKEGQTATINGKPVIFTNGEWRDK